MLTSFSEMRSRARKSLSGHWSEAVVITLVYVVVTCAISGITSFLPFLSFLGLATVIFQGSYNVALYRVHRGSDAHDKLLDLLFDLRDGKWWKYLCYQLLWLMPCIVIIVLVIAIYVVALISADALNDFSAIANADFRGLLWLLPLLLVMFVALYYVTLGMFLVPYLVFDHPELGAMDTLRRSWFMMKGHKWDLFLLNLSFIGWDLLSVLTLFILQLWITPYKITANAEFYLQVKAEHGELGDKVIYEEDIVVVEAEEIG